MKRLIISLITHSVTLVMSDIWEDKDYFIAMVLVIQHTYDV